MDWTELLGGDSDSIELKMTLARRALLTRETGEICSQLAYDLMVKKNIEKPVVLVCQMDDLMGRKVLRRLRPEVSRELDDRGAYYFFALSLEELEEREDTILAAIVARMDGLFGYYPIVVCAYEGITVLPYPLILTREVIPKSHRVIEIVESIEG